MSAPFRNFSGCKVSPKRSKRLGINARARRASSSRSNNAVEARHQGQLCEFTQITLPRINDWSHYPISRSDIARLSTFLELYQRWGGIDREAKRLVGAARRVSNGGAGQ
jgi:hypothetical protein